MEVISYNITDILDKFIEIIKKRESIYESIALDNDENLRIKVLSSVFIKEEEDNVAYYEDVKKRVSNDTDLINVAVYDKMSFLMNEYGGNMDKHSISSVRELINFHLHIEKDMLALLIDLKGRYVKQESDTTTEVYKTLLEIIDHKAKYMKMIEESIKG